MHHLLLKVVYIEEKISRTAQVKIQFKIQYRLILKRKLFFGLPCCQLIHYSGTPVPPTLKKQ